jgi:hypothetical protein
MTASKNKIEEIVKAKDEILNVSVINGTEEYYNEEGGSHISNNEFKSRKNNSSHSSEEEHFTDNKLIFLLIILCLEIASLEIKLMQCFGIDYKKHFKNKVIIKKNDIPISYLISLISEVLKSKGLYYIYNEKLIRADSKEKNEITVIDELQFIVEVEKYIVIIGLKITSLNQSESKIIVSAIIKNDYLPSITKIIEYSLPYIFESKLYFTSPGYDVKTQYYTLKIAPEVKLMDNEQASERVKGIFEEFCFPKKEENLYLSRAIAYLLTLLICLLTNYGRPLCFFLNGNTPGVGKDYLLGLIFILFENKQPVFNAPCGSDAEYRKNLFSACRAMINILIFSNIKGHLDSQAVEHFSTSPTIRDRKLGVSESKEYHNNLLLCFSGNEVALSKDMKRRVLEIRLEYHGEKINDRKFKRNLYEYLANNRPTILNALYSMIHNWYHNGAPRGKKIPSFGEWSSTVSGILTTNGFQDPFDEPTSTNHSLTELDDINSEDKDFRGLVELWRQRFNTNEVKAENLRDLANDANLFKWLNLENNGGKASFSKVLTSYENTTYDNVRIRIRRLKKYPKFYLEEIL